MAALVITADEGAGRQAPISRMEQDLKAILD